MTSNNSRPAKAGGTHPGTDALRDPEFWRAYSAAQAEDARSGAVIVMALGVFLGLVWGLGFGALLWR